MYYAIPYFLYYLFLLILYILGKQNRNIYKRCIVIAAVSYLFFFGLRGYIFTDCFQYLDFFHDIPLLNRFQKYDGNFEVGYVAVNDLLSHISNNPFFFQFAMTLLDVIALIVILKRETNQQYLLAFALLIPFWEGVQMNLFRNIKAILICFYAIRYIREKKLIPYVCCIFLAFLFHQTAVFFLPLYWVIDKPCKKEMIALCCIALVLYFVSMTFMADYIQAFGAMLTLNMAEKAEAFSTNAQSAGFTLGFLYRLLLMFVLLKNYDRISKVNLCMLNLALLYVFCCTAFNSMIVFRDRFSALFALSLPCILPYVFNGYKGIFKKMLVTLNFIFVLGMVYAQNSNGAAQYENLLFGISSEKAAQMRVFKDIYEYMK